MGYYDPSIKLIDSRVRECERKRKQRPGPLGWMDQNFCINCGRESGLVLAEYIMFLCNDCAEKTGGIPGAIEIPEALVRAAQPRNQGR